MAAHRLYGVFFTGSTGSPWWALTRNGRQARRYARRRRALCVSMPLTPSRGPWDAPTFRALADRHEGDWRPRLEAP